VRVRYTRKLCFAIFTHSTIIMSMEPLNRKQGDPDMPLSATGGAKSEKVEEADYEAEAGLHGASAMNIGRALPKDELEAALAEADAAEIANLKTSLGVEQKVTVRSKAEIMGQPASAPAAPAETKANDNETNLNLLRGEIANVKDFAELYQVLHEADKELQKTKNINADALRALIEDSRQGFNTESLRSITRYLGVRSKAIELVAAETKAKIDSIADTRKALKAELAKGGAADKVALNDKLNAELRNRDTLAIKLEVLGKLGELSKEVPLEESEGTEPAQIVNRSPKTPSTYKPLRPAAGMGGGSANIAGAPEKEEKWSLWKEVKHWFGPKRS
jgi:hypothetical protein